MKRRKKDQLSRTSAQKKGAGQGVIPKWGGRGTISLRERGSEEGLGKPGKARTNWRKYTKDYEEKKVRRGKKEGDLSPENTPVGSRYTQAKEIFYLWMKGMDRGEKAFLKKRKGLNNAD